MGVLLRFQNSPKGALPVNIHGTTAPISGAVYIDAFPITGYFECILSLQRVGIIVTQAVGFQIFVGDPVLADKVQLSDENSAIWQCLKGRAETI